MRIMQRTGGRIAASWLVAASAGLLAFVSVSAASATPAPASQAASARQAAAPKLTVFGQGTWIGTGRRYELSKDGPYPLEIDTRFSFTLKVNAAGAVSGTYRQQGTSTPKGNGWAGQIKHIVDAKLQGNASDNIAIVGELSTGGTLTYRGKGVPLASTKPFRSWLGATASGCNVVRSKYWTARRTAGTGKTPTAAMVATTEQNALRALERANAAWPNKSVPLVQAAAQWLSHLNRQIEAARSCGVAPAGYARGLAGRADVATLLRDLIKRLVSPSPPDSEHGFVLGDVVRLVDAALSAGLLADPTVKQGLENWLNQGLGEFLGKPGVENQGTVDWIERVARRAGMTSLAERAATG
jgi:hypothetical protein